MSWTSAFLDTPILELFLFRIKSLLKVGYVPCLRTSPALPGAQPRQAFAPPSRPESQRCISGSRLAFRTDGWFSAQASSSPTCHQHRALIPEALPSLPSWSLVLLSHLLDPSLIASVSLACDCPCSGHLVALPSFHLYSLYPWTWNTVIHVWPLPSPHLVGFLLRIPDTHLQLCASSFV